MRKFQFCLIIVTPLLLLLSACTKPIVSSGPSGSSAYESEAQRQAGEGAGGISEESLGSAGSGGSTALSPSEAAAARKAFENEDIFFEYDSALLTPQAQEILRDKAQYMKDNSGVQIIIEGHCDERGTSEYNLALGEQRARTTQQFLVALGISESRITTVSYGEERPLDRGNNEEAWVRNRRAHFIITR
jgi:peptidoglycan-associated lipoprotein